MKFVQVFMDSSKTIDETKKKVVKIISSYDDIKKKYDSISFGGISLRKNGLIKVIQHN